MQIHIHLKNMREVRRKLARLARLGHVQSWLGGIGERLQESHRQRHERGVAPDGYTRWTVLSPLTRKQKKRPTKLYESGDMLNSLSYQVQGDRLQLGFSDEKAIWHHEGTRPYKIKPKKAKALYIPGVGVRDEVNHPGLPARPLLGTSAQDEAGIFNLLDDLIDEAIKG